MLRRISFAMLLFSVSLLAVLAAGSPLRADDPPGGGNDGPQTGGIVLAYTWYADVNSAGNSSGLDHALDDSVIFIEGTLHSDPIKTDPERDITYRLSKTIEMGYQYKRKNLDGKKGLLWNHVEQGTAHGTITVPKSKARKNDFYKTDFKLRINPRKLLVVNKTYYVRELVADLASKNMEEWKNLVNPNREVASFIVIDPFEGEED